jgi:ABC-type amino acid transport substrate-binding protein
MEDIHKVSKSTKLKKSFAQAAQRGKLARSILKRGSAKALGTAIALVGVFLAYEDARAEGMTPDQAKAYAVASVIGGDLVYDAMKAGSDEFWSMTNAVANGVGGKYSQALKQSMQNTKPKNAPNTSAVDAWLDRVLKNGQDNRDYKPPSSLKSK